MVDAYCAENVNHLQLKNFNTQFNILTSKILSYLFSSCIELFWYPLKIIGTNNPVNGSNGSFRGSMEGLRPLPLPKEAFPF